MACRALVAHLPRSQDLDSSGCADSVLRFCGWADSTLPKAEDAIQGVAAALPEPSLTLALVAASRRLLDSVSSNWPMTTRVEIWDTDNFRVKRTIRPFAVPCSWEKASEHVRAWL